MASTIGCGSTFSFKLNLAIASDESSSSANVTISCDAFRDKLMPHPQTLLIADANSEYRQYLRDLCQSWGYSVVEAHDQKSAFTAFLTAQPTISAAIIDQMLPRLDGWEFLRQVRESSKHPVLPVVLISDTSAYKPVDFPENLEFDEVYDRLFVGQELACFLCYKLKQVDQPPDFCPFIVSELEDLQKTPIPAEELTYFRQLLALGLVVRIQTWAIELAERDATYQALADHIVLCCQKADLIELTQLANALTTI